MRPFLTMDSIRAIRKAQEEEFLLTHGYEWPNCEVVECDYKAWVKGGSAKCFNHTRGLPIIPIEEYHR